MAWYNRHRMYSCHICLWAWPGWRLLSHRRIGINLKRGCRRLDHPQRLYHSMNRMRFDYVVIFLLKLDHWPRHTNFLNPLGGLRVHKWFKVWILPLKHIIKPITDRYRMVEPNAWAPIRSYHSYKYPFFTWDPWFTLNVGEILEPTKHLPFYNYRIYYCNPWNRNSQCQIHELSIRMIYWQPFLGW